MYESIKCSITPVGSIKEMVDRILMELKYKIAYEIENSSNLFN